MNSHFHLHPRLAADCRPVGDLAQCRLLVMNDRRFPWTILVPRVPDLRELHDLPAEATAAVMTEIALLSRVLGTWPGVEKVNVGALGNLVEQLHVHVVGRRAGDAAWPGPVWGAGAAEPYEPAALDAVAAGLAARLGERLTSAP
jgi:diadenosine tetraphosphate (Ap4A) HIT family hydrolase